MIDMIKFKQMLYCLLFIGVLAGCTKEDNATIELDTTDIKLSNDSEPVVFTVKSNVSWSIIQNGNFTFNVSPLSGTAGVTAVSVQASPNNTDYNREAVLNITGGNITRSLAVTQNPVSFSLSHSILQMSNKESSKTFAITSNTAWKISSSSLPEWIKEISPLSGTGNSNITVTVNDSNNRTGKNSYILKIEYSGTFTSVVIEQDVALNNAPSAPTGLVPENGATNVSRIPLFEWNASTDAENDKINYTVSFSKDKTSWKSISAGTMLSSSVNSTTGALEPNTVYYYKITADDGYNNSKTESDIMSFTTGDSDAYGDGEFKVCFKSSKPSPIKLVFTGDGYLPEHFKYGGLFDTDTDEAIEGLFSIEPYKSYKEYFSVYKIAAYSKESGISNTSKNITKDTKFKCVMEGGSSTGISCDDKIVFSHVLGIPDITENDLKNNSIAVIINEDVYAGTCIMYSDGRSVGMIPVYRSSGSNQTKFVNVVCHEFGGHGFGRLADEYRYYDVEIESDMKSTLSTWQGFGYYLNLSLTSDKTKVPWAQFIGLNGYSHVGVYSGGFQYTKGVWRSEAISCMEDNRMYFNTQSRYLIVERIMDIAKEDFSLEKFLQKDVQKTDNTSTSSNTKGGWEGVPYDFVPLAPPIMIVE